MWLGGLWLTVRDAPSTGELMLMLPKAANVTPTPLRTCCQQRRLDLHKILIYNDLETGELGFEPGFPGSGRRWPDTGLTLQNQGFKTTCDDAAPGRIVVALRSHGHCCCQIVANLSNEKVQQPGWQGGLQTSGSDYASPDCCNYCLAGLALSPTKCINQP